MRTLILYTSSAGSTKAYAEEIALGMGTEAIEFNKKKFRKMNLDDYDTIVYGGWVKGSQIQGIDDFLSRWEDMEKKNCDGMIIYGNYHSNLCRILSVACKREEIPCYMIYNQDDIQEEDISVGFTV